MQFKERRWHQNKTHHLPVALHFPEDTVLPPHAPLPAVDDLVAVGHALVLVPAGKVAHMEQPLVLFHVCGREHVFCHLGTVSGRSQC